MTLLNSTFNPGKLEVIVGTMFSGKSKELIERGYRAEKFGDIEPFYFKPRIDTRDQGIVSRSGQKVKAIQVDKGLDILDYMEEANEPSVVIIDEAQFFDDTLLYAVQLLKIRNHNIVIAGLDKDFRAQPFGIMPKLMALSDSAIRKIYPVCSVTGCVQDGNLPQRLRNGQPDSALSPTVIIEGSSDEIDYRPVCSKHHQVPDIEEYIKSKMQDVLTVME